MLSDEKSTFLLTFDKNGSVFLLTLFIYIHRRVRILRAKSSKSCMMSRVVGGLVTTIFSYIKSKMYNFIMGCSTESTIFHKTKHLQFLCRVFVLIGNRNTIKVYSNYQL